MGRKRRPQSPGAVFHLTARTQGHEPWFTPTLRTRVVDYTAYAIRTTDANLLAYAIMPNHLHLVVRQGRCSLGRVMQPLLRRIALLVQRSHGVEGHVFERRFGDQRCLDPEYARNAIVYTHLNPLRAGLVEDPRSYGWSSHAFYAADGPRPATIGPVLAVDDGLRLFAPREGSTIEDIRRSYSDFITWRIRFDRHRREEQLGEGSGYPGPRPSVFGGDLCWSQRFAPLFRAPARSRNDDADCPSPLSDLGQIAARTLAERGPRIPLDAVRSSYKGPEVVRLRRTMIKRMSAAGHKGAAIARYLRVSDQCVSNVLRSAPPR